MEAALFLASPPFATASLLLVIATGLALLVGHGAIAAVSALGLATLAGSVVIGLIEARAGRRAWAALAMAPWYLFWKVSVQLRAAAAVRRREQHFPATIRATTADEIAEGTSELTP